MEVDQPQIRLTAAMTVSLILVLGWQWWVGLGEAGCSVAVGGDAGLCLALSYRALGGIWPLALASWGLCALWHAALAGISPLWLLVAGWPAWAVCFPGKRPGYSNTLFFTVATAGLISLSRGGLKLLSGMVLGEPGALTSNGAPILFAWWAEFLPNLVFLALFGGWLAGMRGPDD